MWKSNFLFLKYLLPILHCRLQRCVSSVCGRIVDAYVIGMCFLKFFQTFLFYFPQQNWLYATVLLCLFKKFMWFNIIQLSFLKFFCHTTSATVLAISNAFLLQNTNEKNLKKTFDVWILLKLKIELTLALTKRWLEMKMNIFVQKNWFQ